MNKNLLFLISLAFIFSCSNGGNEETPSSFSIVQNSSSSGGQSCSSSIVQSSSSSQTISSTSGDLCAGFVEGTEREHYGKLKKQICDKRDGKKYVYITIDMGETSQTWLAENLNYDGGNGSIGKCYENDISNCDIYGRLYDWNEAMTLCPSGWRLPSREEWEALFSSVGGEAVAAKHLKAGELWLDCGSSGSNKKSSCEDTYGFSALPNGYGGSIETGVFSNIEEYGLWWTSTGSPSGSTNHAVEVFMLNFNNEGHTIPDGKWFLLGVRCVEN